MSFFALFPHQEEAIKKLNDFFKDKTTNTSGILSIPTGGGKTFTAVHWILSELKKQDRKVIWLAQSFELLNQAFQTFSDNSDISYIKVISSHLDHKNIEDISGNEKILIITTQTAIRAVKQENSGLYQFIEKNKHNNMIVVLDEAHHAPAYGCRNLLTDLKSKVTSTWLLGLTATPTYTDTKRRGWLWNIFDGGVIYQVNKGLLQRQRILAKENIIRKKTPMRIEVDDALFDALVRQHRDIPENIIEQLASNSERNDFIINDYLSNISTYGKTIIFLDRWFQCLYFKNKLIENGIKADAIFYQNDADIKTKTGQSLSNKQVIDSFRDGQLQVLLNVKMLTEGADVPDVNTVFITRDTTSHILLQQMIGRALRGERAGGKKDVANIVLFGDNWDKSIAWAMPEGIGDVESERIVRKTIPHEQISINLIEQLVKNITFESAQPTSFMDMIPIGWYQTEFVVFEQGMESIELVRETVLVYPDTQKQYEDFIQYDEIIKHDAHWAKESLDENFISKEINRISAQYFIDASPSHSSETRRGIIALGRHIAQNRDLPKLTMFVNRDSCNLESIANGIFDLSPLLQYQKLLIEYNCPGTLWNTLYPTFYQFKTSVDMYVNKLLFSNGYISPLPSNDQPMEKSIAYAEEAVKQQAVKARDNNTCGRCGLTSKETKLDVDTILPIALYGGVLQVSNMQTLCTKCKKINMEKHINYVNHSSPLHQKNTLIRNAFDLKYVKNISRIKAALRGSINETYQSNAVFDILCSRRSNSEHFSVWTIMLYAGNNPEWLQSQEKFILDYIHTELMQHHVNHIKTKVLM